MIFIVTKFFSHFTGNDTIFACGGSIYYENSNGNLNSCRFFKSNSSTELIDDDDDLFGYAIGGVINFLKSTNEINECLFINNSCSTIGTNSKSYGGGINLPNSITTFSKCNFSINMVQSFHATS